MPYIDAMRGIAMRCALVCLGVMVVEANAQSVAAPASPGALDAPSNYRLIDLGIPEGMRPVSAAITNDGELFSVLRTYDPQQVATLYGFSWSPREGWVDHGVFLGHAAWVADVSASGYIVGGVQVGMASYLTAGCFCPRTGGVVMIEISGRENCSQARAVNNAGRIVGDSWCSGPTSHAFSWTESEGPIDLGSLGGSFSSASELSDAGQIVGWSSLPGDEEVHAFSWTARDGMIDLGTLGGEHSYARAVSNSGHVVGEADTVGVGGTRHAFLWTARSGMIDLGTLGGPYSYATGVNDSGAVIGVSDTADSSRHAFFWTPKSGMVDIDVGYYDIIGPKEINQSGIVIGYDYVWSQRTGLVALEGVAMSINSRGQIVGDSGGHMVIWEPSGSRE